MKHLDEIPGHEVAWVSGERSLTDTKKEKNESHVCVYKAISWEGGRGEENTQQR